MKEKRIQKTSYATLILLVGLLVLITSGLSALMYPGKSTFNLGLLGAGAALVFLAFAVSPTLLVDLFTSRRSWLWINDIILVCSMIGIGILLTYVGSRHHVKFDFTRDRLFSISDSTIKVLQTLQKEVRITSFYPTGAVEGRMVEDLLSEYKRFSGKVRHERVDPFKDPLKTKAMNVRAAGTVVVQCEDNRKDLSDEEIFIKPNMFMRQQQQERPKFQGEQAFTSAILNVTQGGKKKVFLVTGHGEPSITAYNQEGLAGVQQFLTRENYDISEGSLMEPIATGTSVIGIISPKKSFHPDEIKALKSFVERKGNLLVALDPDSCPPEFSQFLAETYGILPSSEIIINPRAVNNNPVIIVPQYQPHPIVKAQIEKKSGALFQLARGLTVDPRPQWKSDIFMKTSELAYGKRKMDEVMQGNLEFTNGVDVRGPLTLAVALEGIENASGTRAVILGDADFATNMLLSVQGNSDLVVNTVNWLAGQEQLISIRPKTLEFGQIDMEKLDKEAINRIMILCVIVSPLLVVLLGGAVWFARRRV